MLFFYTVYKGEVRNKRLGHLNKQRDFVVPYKFAAFIALPQSNHNISNVGLKVELSQSECLRIRLNVE